MKEQITSEKHIALFRKHLIREEKSAATIEKYIRDTRAFVRHTDGQPLHKELVLAYKKKLLDRGYAIRSINSMLASINCFLNFIGRPDCKVKTVRVQQQIYCAEEKELSKEEYYRLLEVAKDDPQIYLILQTICATGIRVSELCCFTVEAIREGSVVVRCKGKVRSILIPGKLRKRLLQYARDHHCMSGNIFAGKKGKGINRSVVWRKMKKLCMGAGVNPNKVFPHNLRRLFARTFYGMEKDIAKLADILGHSSITTTRIYIMSTGVEHRKKIECLGLVI